MSKSLFDYEAESLSRVFYTYLSLYSTMSCKLKDSPLCEYMDKICSKYCYDCSVIMSLNLFLSKWEHMINNSDEYLHYKEYISGKILQCIRDMSERFSFSTNKFEYLCGCINWSKSYEEDKEWESFENKTAENEYIFIEKNSWRNDLKKHLIELNNHLKYLKKPHIVYRNNILVPLIMRLNNDCVNNIIEYL